MKTTKKNTEGISMPEKLVLVAKICVMVAICCLSFGAGFLFIDTVYLGIGIPPNVMLVLAVLGIGSLGIYSAVKNAQSDENKKVDSEELMNSGDEHLSEM